MTYDLQSVLYRFDINDLDIADTLDRSGLEKFLKDISWLLPQWVISSTDENEHKAQIIMFDEICNYGWGSFYYHPKLQAKLLSLIGPGRKVRHKFYRPSGGRATATKNLYEFIQREIEDVRPDDIDLWVQNTNIDELEVLMDDHGIALEDRQAILSEYDKVRTN